MPEPKKHVDEVAEDAISEMRKHYIIKARNYLAYNPDPEAIIAKAINTALSTQSATIADQQKRIEELEGKCTVKDEAIRELKALFDICGGHGAPIVCKDRAEIYYALNLADNALSSPGQEVVSGVDAGRVKQAVLDSYQRCHDPGERIITLHYATKEAFHKSSWTILEVVAEQSRNLSHLTPNQQEKGQ